MAAAPSQSKCSGASGLRLSSSWVRAITTPAMTSGTFTRKADCQPNVSIRMPPTTGPPTVSALVAAAQMPKARPRSAPSKVALISASEVGTRKAPKAPWTRRPRIRISMVGARPQASEAAPKPARPMTKKRRRPYRSASAPARMRSADSESR